MFTELFSRACDFFGSQYHCYTTAWWSTSEGYVPIWEYVFRLIGRR